jgi:hypothetical protein
MPSRIAAYEPVDVDDPADREVTRRWAVETLLAMYDTLNTPFVRQHRPDAPSTPIPLHPRTRKSERRPPAHRRIGTPYTLAVRRSAKAVEPAPAKTAESKKPVAAAS